MHRRAAAAATTHRYRVAAPLVLAAACATVMARPALAVEPGIDIAAPRVAITTVDAATIQFHPAVIAVEQDDHVRWSWTGGTHNTTSATTTSSCVASGLWASNLNSLSTSFTRQFTTPPGVVPFYCQPHCGLGMRGQVVVTTPIDAKAVLAAGGAVQLDWTGGGGVYRIFRSASPLFPTAATTVLTGPQGTTVLTFTDTNGGTPPLGGAFFYLVMNHFGP